MRRIGSGMARLDEYWAQSGGLEPRNIRTRRVFFATSRNGSMPDGATSTWSRTDWALSRKAAGIRLRMLDYAYVLMAEGMIWVAEENVERALANFSLVLSLRSGDLRPGGARARAFLEFPLQPQSRRI